MLGEPSGLAAFFQHGITERLDAPEDRRALDFFAVEFQAQAFCGVAHRSFQHAVHALQGMLDRGGTGGAIHAVDAQSLVTIAIADFRPGRLRQLARPAHAELLRIVMQAKAGAAVFADQVYFFQPFGL